MKWDKAQAQLNQTGKTHWAESLSAVMDGEGTPTDATRVLGGLKASGAEGQAARAAAGQFCDLRHRLGNNRLGNRGSGAAAPDISASVMRQVRTLAPQPVLPGWKSALHSAQSGLRQWLADLSVGPLTATAAGFLLAFLTLIPGNLWSAAGDASQLGQTVYDPASDPANSQANAPMLASLELAIDRSDAGRLADEAIADRQQKQQLPYPTSEQKATETPAGYETERQQSGSNR